MILTKMQKHYIWLAGSFPHLPVEQGQGKRSKELLYAVAEDKLVLFGYSSPLYFMEGRYFRQMAQDKRLWTLTDLGTEAFQKLLVGQFGLHARVREVKLKPRVLE